MAIKTTKSTNTGDYQGPKELLMGIAKLKVKSLIEIKELDKKEREITTKDFKKKEVEISGFIYKFVCELKEEKIYDGKSKAYIDNPYYDMPVYVGFYVSNQPKRSRPEKGKHCFMNAKGDTTWAPSKSSINSQYFDKKNCLVFQSYIGLEELTRFLRYATNRSEFQFGETEKEIFETISNPAKANVQKEINELLKSERDSKRKTEVVALLGVREGQYQDVFTGHVAPYDTARSIAKILKEAESPYGGFQAQYEGSNFRKYADLMLNNQPSQSSEQPPQFDEEPLDNNNDVDLEQDADDLPF